MTYVYLLWHQNHETEDDKLLGVFSTENGAWSATRNFLELPGFIKSPYGFLVDKYELDELCWKEGYGI